MELQEVVKRLTFIKYLYEHVIIRELDQRNIPEAKKDIKALETVIALLERGVI